MRSAHPQFSTSCKSYISSLPFDPCSPEQPDTVYVLFLNTWSHQPPERCSMSPAGTCAFRDRQATISQPVMAPAAVHQLARSSPDPEEFSVKGRYACFAMRLHETPPLPRAPPPPPRAGQALRKRWEVTSTLRLLTSDSFWPLLAPARPRPL